MLFSRRLINVSSREIIVVYGYVFYGTCLAYPVVSVDRWGATDDLAVSSLHSSRLSDFLMAAPSVKSVHSGMLSSHLFFCLPRLLPVSDLFVGYVVSVCDAEEFSEASHLHGLYLFSAKGSLFKLLTCSSTSNSPTHPPTHSLTHSRKPVNASTLGWVHELCRQVKLKHKHI